MMVRVRFGLLALACSMGLHAMNKAYVSNRGVSPNTVSVIDTDTATVIGTVADQVPATFGIINVMAISPDGRTVYGANDGVPGSISVINTITNMVTGLVTDLPIPSFNTTMDLAFTPNGLKAYAVNYGDTIDPTTSTVAVINTATNTATRLVDATSEPFNGSYYIAMAFDGSKAYVSNSASNTVSVIDIATDTVERGIPGFTSPNPVAVTSDGKTLYVGNNAGAASTIGIVDLATDTITYVADLLPPTFNDPYALVISPDGKTLYVNNWNAGNNTLSIVDIAQQRVTDVVTYSPASQIVYMALTPNGKTLYAPSPGFPSPVPAGSVSLLDVPSKAITDPVTDLATPTFNGPFALAMPRHTQPWGSTASDVFLTQIDHINVIAWNVPIGGLAPVEYRVYRNAALTDLAGTALITKFADHNRIMGTSYTYYVASVGSSGLLSVLGSVTVA